MTEYIYAVINNDDKVENIIVSDNDDATIPLKMLIPEAKDIVLTTLETGPAYIGGDLLDGKFRVPSPYPSWQWESETESWQAPVPYPQDDYAYTWNEQSQSWDQFTIPPDEALLEQLNNLETNSQQ